MRAYLEALEAHKPKRGRKRTPETMKARIATIDETIDDVEMRTGIKVEPVVAKPPTEADFLAVNAAFVNRRFVRSAHDSGKEVYVWTVNDAPTMSAG